MANMFLPTLAATVMHKLKYYSIEPIHYLMDTANEASQSLSVEKKSRVQVLFNYHNIRLQTCWKWLKECYGKLGIFDLSLDISPLISCSFFQMMLMTTTGTTAMGLGVEVMRPPICRLRDTTF